MGETIEKKLQDFNGYQILKVTDNKGLLTEKITYIAYDKDDNLVDAKSTLKELKSVLKRYGGF